MTSAPIPGFRAELASSEHVEAALSEAPTSSEFVVRAVASLVKAQPSGEYVDVADTLAKLDAMLTASQQAKSKRLSD